MLIHFIHGYYCIYRPWQPLAYLYFPYHCISLIYFSFTMIRMFLYAQIYWLAEFGDVSCLQFNYLRVETLTLTWVDLVGQFGRTFVGVKSDKTLCPTWVFDRWYTWRDLYDRKSFYIAGKMTVCSKTSGQKDRYILHMHRTRDRVFLLINMILCQCH